MDCSTFFRGNREKVEFHQPHLAPVRHNQALSGERNAYEKGRSTPPGSQHPLAAMGTALLFLVIVHREPPENENEQYHLVSGRLSNMTTL